MNYRFAERLTSYVYFTFDTLTVDVSSVINFFRGFEINLSESEVAKVLNKAFNYMGELTAEEKAMYLGCIYYDSESCKLIPGLYLSNASVSSGEFFVHEHTLVLGPSACKQNGFTSVRLPKSVQVISSFCFDNCARLTGINLEDVVYIEPAAFAYCLELQGIKLSKARAVGKYAFRFCTSLSSVEKNSECVVYQDAFSYCSALER